jgi:hypothetical protein
MQESDFKASVGKHGPNKKQCFNTVPDQEMVVKLLNMIPERLGGAGGKLRAPIRWGVVSEELYQAILRFQKAHPEEHLSVDGHVDPHEKTLRLMLRLVKTVIPEDPGIHPDIPPDQPVPQLPPEFTTPRAKHYRLRYRGGGSVGPFIIHRFDIWDIENNLSAEYTLEGAAASIGLPTSVTGAGDFVGFVTPDKTSVKNFGGPASFTGVGGGDSSAAILVLLFFEPPLRIQVSTGFTEGFDVVSVGGGALFMKSFHPGPPRPVPTGATA